MVDPATTLLSIGPEPGLEHPNPQRLATDEDAWRALMPAVRKVAARLAEAEVVRITRGDITLSAGEIDHGPIRLRRGRGFAAG